VFQSNSLSNEVCNNLLNDSVIGLYIDLDLLLPLLYYDVLVCGKVLLPTNFTQIFLVCWDKQAADLMNG
jgi:hypothetical protein